MRLVDDKSDKNVQAVCHVEVLVEQDPEAS